MNVALAVTKRPIIASHALPFRLTFIDNGGPGVPPSPAGMKHRLQPAQPVRVIVGGRGGARIRTDDPSDYESQHARPAGSARPVLAADDMWMSSCAWLLGAVAKRLGALMQSAARYPNIKRGQEFTGYS